MSSFFSLSLLAVIVAALLDIVANLLLAKSQGFRRKFIGFASLGMVGLAFYALSLAVRDMDLAVAYAMWGGFGILGTSIGGWLLLGQRLKPCAWLGMVLLIGGMTVYTAAELTGLLSAAGFCDIKTYGDPDKGWLCASARKPERIEQPDDIL